MKSLSDEQLVAYYAVNKSGDCFEVLYQRYYSKVVKKCIFYTKDSVLSQDLAQDIFLKLFEKMSSFRAEAKFSTWLNSVVFHHCVDYLKQNKYRPAVLVDEGALALVYDDNQTDLADFRVQQFYDALSLLEEEDQTLLRLKYLEQMSIHELSVLKGLTVSAIKMRLMRSRERLGKNYLSLNTL